METLSRSSTIPVASRLLAASIILFPLSIQHIDFRASFSPGLEITSYKSSPAFAAFQDLTLAIQEDETSALDFLDSSKVVTLASGTKLQSHFALKIQRRTIAAKGLTLKSADTSIMVASNGIKLNARQFRERPLYVAGEVRSSSPPLSPIAKLAEQLVEDQLIRSPHPKIEKQIATASGTTILVGGSGPTRSTSRSQNASRPEVFSPDRGTRPAAEVVDQPSVDGPAVTVSDKKTRIRGQLEMAEGLAFLGAGNSIRIARYENGQPQEKGQIWVNQAKYEISVEQSKGFLVAELIEKNGQVLGRGQVSLTDLNLKDSRMIEDLHIAMRPVATLASLRASSAYSYGRHLLPIKNAKVEIEGYLPAKEVDHDGLLNNSSLNPSSTFVARASAPDHWPSLIVAQSELTQDVRLLSNSLARALINLNLPRHEIHDAEMQGIVWGRVTRDGNAVAGARVEMAGPNMAIYLDEQFMPDQKRKSTSKNGLFAFLKVPAGMQSLRVTSDNLTYPAQILVTEQAHVSYADFQLRNDLKTQMDIVDGLNPEKNLQAVVRFLGTESELNVPGSGLVRYSVASDPQYLEADAGPDYALTRLTLTGFSNHTLVPMISQSWLRKISAASGILAVPELGTVVGFFENQESTVSMTGYSPFEKPSILYFDKDGELLQSNQGVVGGGFVILNAPLGMQTVYVQPVNSASTTSTVVLSEPEYVHVLSDLR